MTLPVEKQEYLRTRMFKVIDYFLREGTWVLAAQTIRGYGVHFEEQDIIEWYSSRSAFEAGEGPYNMSQYASPEEAVRSLLET